MQILFKDLRFGLRMLRKNPSFTILALLTLTLGIGASTAIFSVVNAIALRPMTGRDNAHLLAVAAHYPADEDAHKFSFLDYQQFRSQSASLADTAAYLIAGGVLTSGSRSDRALACYVSDNFFSALAMQPSLGQLLLSGDRGPTAALPVVVLGYTYWQHQLGGDPNIIGKSLAFDGRPLTIVGIAPKEFIGPFTPLEISAYLPLTLMQLRPGSATIFTDRTDRELYMLAQPGPGVGHSQVQASFHVIAARLSQEYPAADAGMSVDTVLERLARPSPDDSSATLMVVTLFLAMVGLTILLVCLDVANLLLARATSRIREMAVRISLGASRARLLRQLLTESLLLSGLGGLTGTALGWWLSRLIAAIRLPTGIPIHLDSSFDWRVLAGVGGLVVMCVVLLGVAPARQAFRIDVSAGLGAVSTPAFGSGVGRLRGTLVVPQVAFSLIVLVLAGLFLRSLATAQRMDLGFRAHGILNLTIDGRKIGYDHIRGPEFFRSLKERVSALPGVTDASFATAVPMGDYLEEDRVWKEGQIPLSESQIPVLNFNTVDEDYFRTLQTRILRGRAFTTQDRIDTPRVAVVNQTMARLFWPGEDALGRRFYVGKLNNPEAELVVGIAQDGKYASLFEKPQPSFYLPLAQRYSLLQILQVRAARDPEALAPALERTIHSLNASVPIYDVMTMEQALGGHNGFFLLRIGTAFAGSLGILCLFLAVMGVYGVMSYTVSRRSREIGIRMAVGARPRDVLRLMIWRGVGLTLAGIVLGIAGSLALARLLVNLLYGVSATDPLTFGVVAVLLVLVSLAACYIPARRAMRVDPMVALKS